MKKILIIFASLSQLLIAQTTEPTTTTPKNRKIALGISFSTDYSYRSLKASSDFYKPLVQLRDSVELPVFGFTTGLKLTTLLKKRFTFETGLLFSQKGYKDKPTIFVANTPDPHIPKTASYQLTYSSIDIPIKLSFYPIKTVKAGFLISAGIINNIFITEKKTSTYVYNNGSTQTVKDRSIGFGYQPSLLLSIGYQQQLSERLFFKVEPTYRRQIFDINSSGAYKTYYYSFGLDLSLYLKI
jgi:hypothetical protein